jgi:NAD(P)-dependent dehydrogenase (short-subunit alcohol dehydrogenase family)
MAQKIIITGANGGLGSAVTQKLLNEGYEVKGTIIPGDEGTEKIRESFDNNHNLTLSKLDVLNEQQVENYLSESGDFYGAVLTVGGFMMKSLQNTTWNDVDKMIDLNFKSAFNFAKYLVTLMKEQNKGKIFFISSKPGLEKGGKDLAAYALSKNMLIKLAEMVNEEFRGTEATASVIAPDLIDTSPNRQAMPNADYNKWIKPEEIARAISFYLSEKAVRIREPILKMYGSH